MFSLELSGGGAYYTPVDPAPASRCEARTFPPVRWYRLLWPRRSTSVKPSACQESIPAAATKNKF